MIHGASLNERVYRWVIFEFLAFVRNRFKILKVNKKKGERAVGVYVMKLCVLNEENRKCFFKLDFLFLQIASLAFFSLSSAGFSNRLDVKQV